MTNNSRKTIIAVVLLLAIALYFIAGTYARYTGTASGDAVATVANWAVKIDGKNLTSETITVNPTFVLDENEYVATDRLAPASSMTATVPIDLTGTEVAVDIIASVTDTTMKTYFGDSAKNVNVKTTVDGEDAESDGNLIKLEEGKAFTAENGKKDIVIKITWNNDGTTDKSDTDIGMKTQKNVTLPVTFTVQQHIA